MHISICSQRPHYWELLHFTIIMYCCTSNHLPSLTPNTANWLFLIFFQLLFWLFGRDASNFPLSKIINYFNISKEIFEWMNIKNLKYFYYIGYLSLKFLNIIQQSGIFTNEFRQFPFMFSSKITTWLFLKL